MRLSLDLQIATDFKPIPSKSTLIRWIKAVLIHMGRDSDTELTVRFVDKAEIQVLNRQYRHKDYATNVLSFPFELPDGIDDLPLLGDIIICLDVVQEEAQAQGKVFYHHLTHMLIHGVLHLLGFDHVQDDEALEMEAYEVDILSGLNISNPYEVLEYA